MEQDELLNMIKTQFEEREQAAAERRRRDEDLMRSQGIVAVIEQSTMTGQLFAHGPSYNGAITLFAMEDGTVRWKRPTE